ncbi:MAG TPA: cytochrome P450 [Jatrophihabitans sp.]|nr:cytochrome P450 [Jatrophihabitans sp.]
MHRGGVEAMGTRMSDVELPAPFGPGVAAQLASRLADLRNGCPVTQVRLNSGEPVWLVLSHEHVSGLLSDPRISVQRNGPPVRRPGGRATQVGLMNMEPPQHTRTRRLCNGALTERRLRRYQPMMEARLCQLLDVAEHEDGPIDLLDAVAKPFTFAVLAEILGLDERHWPELYPRMSQIFQRRRADAEQMNANVGYLEDVVRAELRQRRDDPGDDLLSMVQRAAAGDPDLIEDELVSLATMLLLAGFDSTAQMIGICAVALSGYPELGRRLRADPDHASEVVSELLRWDTSGPFSTPRWATADIKIGGSTIPAGSQLILSFLAANHDPVHFADADQIDLNRPSTVRNLAFGHGPHFCPGSALARLELATTVTTLAGRYPALRLAIPAEQLPWSGQHQQRTLKCLPVWLRPAA